MRAIVQDSYGPADELELREVDRPVAGPTDVLVRVRAAGVDRGVSHVVTGLPYPVRLAGYGLRAPRNPVPGTDVAGVVEAVGTDVTGFRPGDEVFGAARGSYAEFTLAAEDRLAPKPANVSFEQAAAVSVSGQTALQAVRDHGDVQPGQRVLVVGASGGVGSFAVQLAKAFGAEVTGVCSTAKVDLVRSLGADHVVDHSRQDFAVGGRHHDLVLDIGGNATLSRLRRAASPHGTVVIVGGETGGRWLGGSDRQVRAMLLSPFVSQKLATFVCRQDHADLLELAELVGAGTVAPAVDRSFPLSETGTAIRYVEEGRARGKVVVTV